MAQQQFKCPNCKAPLPFDPTAQKLKCEHCGNEYDIASLEALASAENEDPGVPHVSFDRPEAERETLEGTKVYNCESCGAIIEADENTVASICPYCGNNIVLTERVSAGLKPDAIIPFKITKDGLIDRVKAFADGKKLLPKDFFDERRLEKIQGIYVPFWLYTAEINGNANFNATRVRSYRSGKYEVTETSHFLLEREGYMVFSDVPADASSRLDDDLMDSVEPYDLSALVPFNMQYLSGFVADRYDSTYQAEADRAKKRMNRTIEDAFERTTGGFLSVGYRSTNIRASNIEAKYVLLPMYLVNCEYGGKKYRYAVNGQTGKLVGELPISKEKSRKYFLSTMLISAAAIAFAISAMVFS